jgi:hypothetical protein
LHGVLNDWARHSDDDHDRRGLPLALRRFCRTCGACAWSKS